MFVFTLVAIAKENGVVLLVFFFLVISETQKNEKCRLNIEPKILICAGNNAHSSHMIFKEQIVLKMLSNLGNTVKV